MDYLKEAKKTQRAAEDTGDEGYADHARNLALIAIGEQLKFNGEQLKRIADVLEANDTPYGFTIRITKGD